MAGALEAALAGLWAAMLRLKRVDRGADFFMMGGDSLRGAALLDQVRTVFGVEIPAQALFEDAGTVAGMARRIVAARARAASVRTIPRRPPGAPVPLSHAQARAWFLHRLDPAGAAYHESRLWHIDGELDVDALRTAIVQVARRQSSLRTRFAVVDGEPRQHVDDEPSIPFEFVDLSGRDADLDAEVRARIERPFDLAAAAPVRFTLFRRASGRHTLLRVWHHIVSDGLSTPLLQRDLTEAYAAARAGREPRWAPLAVDYADYSVWLAKELAGPAAAASLELWRRRLADLPTLALPADRVRPPSLTFAPGIVSRSMRRETAGALSAIGRDRGATPFVAFLAAFAVLMSRLSDDRDFAIGTPVSGRVVPELAPLVGFFANTLAIRVDLSGIPDYVEVLSRVRDRVKEALEHQQVPFERLVDALGVARDPSRNPVFQVAFAMREHGTNELALEGASVRRDPARHGHAKFDLTTTVLDGPEGVVVHWEYRSDLFDRSTVERMARQFEVLVASIAAAPDCPVASLPIMDAATRERDRRRLEPDGAALSGRDDGASALRGDRRGVPMRRRSARSPTGRSSRRRTGLRTRCARLASPGERSLRYRRRRRRTSPSRGSRC
ncbi:MAG: hypothetical protein IPG84_15470 [Betaproteobacteria bacterium]|nr:hypothetical protein [Betaproteobacteria bacterium]